MASQAQTVAKQPTHGDWLGIAAVGGGVAGVLLGAATAEGAWLGFNQLVHHLRTLAPPLSRPLPVLPVAETLQFFPALKSMIDYMSHFWTGVAVAAVLLLAATRNVRAPRARHAARARTNARRHDWAERYGRTAFVFVLVLVMSWAGTIVGWWWWWSSEVLHQYHRVLYALVPTQNQALQVDLTKLAFDVDTRNLWVDRVLAIASWLSVVGAVWQLREFFRVSSLRELFRVSQRSSPSNAS
jgi:hypothetical protein